MKKAPALLVAVFLLSCGGSGKKHTTTLNAPEIPADWKRYEQPDYVIRYPDGWELHENFAGSELCLLSPLSSSGDLFRENVSIVTDRLVRTISLEKYAAIAIRTVGVEYKAEAVAEKKCILDGQLFYSVSFRSDDGWFRQHYYIREKKVYIVTFWYQPDESDKIKTDGLDIIHSFRLLTE